jgi:hypothetical protein
MKHQDAFVLLPWYVNSSLEQAEIQRLVAHLENCRVCQMELKELQKLSAWANRQPPMSINAQNALNSLMMRINDAESDTTSQTGQQTDGRFFSIKRCMSSGISGNKIFSIRFTQAAAVILIVAVFFQTNKSVEEAPLFRTLSSDHRLELGNQDLRVVFTQDISESELQHIISSLPGLVLSGPNESGVYIIRVLENKGEIQDINIWLMKLRSHKAVIFAEPAFSSLMNKSSG